MNEFLTVASVGIVVSLLFTLLFQYFPGLNTWWAGIASEVKKRIVLLVYLVTGAVVGFAGCVPAFATALGLPLVCVTLPVFLEYVVGTAVAIGAGQGVFELAPTVKAVKTAKAARV